MEHIIKHMKDLISDKTNNANNDSIYCYPLYLIFENIVSLLINIMFDTLLWHSIINQCYEYTIKNVLTRILDYEYRLAKQYGFIDYFENSANYIESKSMLTLTNDLEWWSYILNKYKSLNVVLSKVIENISSYLKHVLTIYANDIADLKRYCNRSILSDSILLESIDLFMGDFHYNKSVTSFNFADGSRWYLKDRNTSNESVLKDFINLLNQYSAKVELGIPDSIDRGNHSWHKHIANTEVPPYVSLEDYYLNLGKLLCVFHILHSQDLIPDNIISSAGIPYIIDFECLFSKYNDTLKGIDKEYVNSVMGTGILPTWMLSGIDERNSISSVLFAFWNGYSHLPIKEGIPKPITVNLIKNFVDGFKYIYNLIAENSETIISELKYLVECHKFCVSRIIIHPTSLYTLLLNEMTTPESMSNTNLVMELVTELNIEHLPNSIHKSIRTSIIKSLENCSVPSFYIKADAKGLFDSFGTQIGEDYDFSIETGLKNIYSRIHNLSEDDLLFQTTIIEDSIKTFLHATAITQFDKFKLIKCSQNRSILLEAATKIASIIETKIFNKDGHINLVCKSRSQIDGHYQVLPMNFNIYDGYGGILIFFETLYNISHIDKYAKLSEGLFDSLIKDALQYIQEKQADANLSVLTGIMGPLYIMELFPDRYYNSEIYISIVNFVILNITKIESCDFMTGIIGILRFVLYSSKIDSNHKDLLFTHCIDILKKNKHVRPDGCIYWSYADGHANLKKELELGGFAHGSASAAAILYNAYEYCGDKEILSLAKGVLVHDSSFYSDEIEGWLDGRTSGEKIDGASWCHGAAGVAVSRLLMFDHNSEDKQILNELNIAFKQMEKVMGLNICICHGMVGNLEVMNCIGNLINDKTYINIVKQWLFTLADRVIKKESLLCGDDSDRELYGLFMGLSGLGYQFLRFYDWKNIPSLCNYSAEILH